MRIIYRENMYRERFIFFEVSNRFVRFRVSASAVTSTGIKRLSAYSLPFPAPIARARTSLVRCYFISNHPPLLSTHSPVSCQLVVVNALFRKTAVHQHPGTRPSLVSTVETRRRRNRQPPRSHRPAAARPLLYKPQPSRAFAQPNYILINFLLHSSGNVPYFM
jgi:hypothetical protein